MSAASLAANLPTATVNEGLVERQALRFSPGEDLGRAASGWMGNYRRDEKAARLPCETDCGSRRKAAMPASPPADSLERLRLSFSPSPMCRNGAAPGGQAG